MLVGEVARHCRPANWSVIVSSVELVKKLPAILETEVAFLCWEQLAVKAYPKPV
jgi:hypothetical protein